MLMISHFSLRQSFSGCVIIDAVINCNKRIKEKKMSKLVISDKVIKKEVRVLDGATYQYDLIVSESNKVASYMLPLYSVEIKMTDKNGKITCARARELFADVGKALSFFKMLYENFVTPLNLPYIIEDELH